MTASTIPQSTSTIPETGSTSEADSPIEVVIRLPDDWSAATVWANSGDYPQAALQWDTMDPTLEATLPGPGSYVFWAETPSSDDGLCFYQALSDPQWKEAAVRDGDTVRLTLSGEVCE